MRKYRSLVFSCGFAILIGAETSVHGQPGPVTIFCNPIGDTTVAGGAQVSVECFFRNDSGGVLGIRGGQIDLPCTLIPDPGATGAITILPGAAGGTTDPDGDGLRGPSDPSSGSVPYLFNIAGQGPFAPSSCIIANTPCLSCPPVILPVSALRYVGSWRYSVDLCATGSFTVAPECTDQIDGICDPMPESTNTTRYRDNSAGMGLLVSLSIPTTTLTVEVGQCCLSGICMADGINENCCETTYPGAVWIAGGTCFDFCPDCLADEHCDDGQFCNGAETCNLATGGCQLGVPPNCPGGGPCTVASCNPALNGGTGACTVSQRPNGFLCGSLIDSECDSPDTCLNGACRTNFIPAGVPCGDPSDSTCDDPDRCDGAGTCQTHHAADGNPCNDDSPCSTSDACLQGLCVGTTLNCDDGLFCNGLETCNPSNGCVPGSNPCPAAFECDEMADQCFDPGIPTVSQWGIIVLALGLLAASKAHSRSRHH